MTNGSSTMDDDGLIEAAMAELKEERLLEAADYLEKVQDKEKLTRDHQAMIKWAGIVRKSMPPLLEPANAEGSHWKKQTENHKHRDFQVHYHVNEKNELECRIDSAIESSLLVPIIAVFNESELYTTWMPSYNFPFKLGVHESVKLKESGKGHQIVKVGVNMPWPYSRRQVIQHAWAVDVIEESNSIFVKILTEDHKDDPAIPETPDGVVLIDFEANILIRPCPDDHPCLAKSKHNYPEGESLILFTLSNHVDAKVRGVPLAFINFVTRQVIGKLWSNLLGVAEDIRDGKRPSHEEAIAAKRDLYDWIESRTDVMIENIKKSKS